MTKLKPFLKSLAKRGLLNTCITLFFILGCSSPATHTYIKENIAQSLQDICKNEYGIDLRARLLNQTLWIYFPVEDMFVRAQKPEKYTEKFAVEHNTAVLKTGLLKIDYKINPLKDEEKEQEYAYNKKLQEKANDILTVLRRVIFSLKDAESRGPKFFCLITADIKYGFMLKELIYVTDLKKVSYQFISWGEYQHRMVQDLIVEPKIIGDKEGEKLTYKDITWEDFIAEQIQYRIKLKFQKPEVDKNADIDKEIIKIVAYTIKTYGFKDFTEAELNNLVTQNKIILNRLAVWEKPTN